MRLQHGIERGPLVARTHEGGAEILERLAPAWRALCAEGPCDEPFYRPEWIAAWHGAFEPEARLVVVTAWRGDRLRAVLPLVERWGTLRGLPVRMLRGAANVHSCRFDVVHGVDDAEEAGRAVWEHLRRRGGFEVIEIPDVPAGGLAERMLGWAREEGHPVGRWESMRTPVVPLPGAGGDFEEWIGEQTTSKFRANLRRRRRKIETRGRLRLQRIDRADPRALGAFYDLEQRGWKGRKGTAIACDPATRSFYDRVAAWAEGERALALYALHLDDAPVAMHFGLLWRGQYFLPKPAFDEAHGDCSPGQLLIHDVLRDLVAGGVECFDFLGPWMEWKADWTGSVRPHGHCYVFRQGPIGVLLHAAKFRLPAALRGR